MYSAKEDYIIEILLEAELFTGEQLEAARAQQQGSESAVETLIRTGIVKEIDVARVCSVNAGREFVDLTHFTPPEEIVSLVSLEDARRYRMVPIGFDENRLQVAVSDPFDFETLDSLNHVLNYDVEISLAIVFHMNAIIWRNDCFAQPGVHV